MGETTASKSWFDTYRPAYKPDWVHAEETLFERAQEMVGRTGALDLAVCVDIARWKAKRASGRVKGNTPDALVMTTRAALDGPEELAVHTLRYLNGVDVPMASAIMTAARPDRFTVIDVNAEAALKSLGVSYGRPDKNSRYWAYLGACRKIAADLGIPLRELDRALWAYGAELKKEA